MKKMLFMIMLLCFALFFQSFAGEWKKDNNGWWFQRNDGTYPVNQWEKINENEKTDWYYFNQDGYMYSNALTPDGYTVAGSGEWITPGEEYMHFSERYPNDYVMISDSENDLAESNTKILVDCGPYYKIEDMYVIKNKEYHLNLSARSVGEIITLNGDKYKITKYDHGTMTIFQLNCVVDNSGQGANWDYLDNEGDNNYILRSYYDDYVYQEILYHGPIYLEKGCVINEITYDVIGDRYQNTVENHFANPYQYGLISSSYIQGTYRTDKNGLITQIDQTYLP